MSTAVVLEAPKLKTSSNVSIRLTSEEAAALERYALTKQMSAEQALEEFFRKELIPLIDDYDQPNEEGRRKHDQNWLGRSDLAYEGNDDPEYAERKDVWQRALAREDLWGSEEDKHWDEWKP